MKKIKEKLKEAALIAGLWAIAILAALLLIAFIVVKFIAYWRIAFG